MADSDDISRRRLLRGATAGIAAAAAGLGSTEAEAHDSKAVAHYRNRPNGGQYCGICRHFCPPGGCEIVAGRIMPHGWCRFWEHRHVGY
jgi:hypothetical protein